MWVSKLLSVKGQRGNTFGSAGCMVSVAYTQLCPGGAKAAIDNV